MTFNTPHLDRFKRTNPPAEMPAALPAELRADPALLAEVRAEYDRLNTEKRGSVPGQFGDIGGIPLIDTCYISRETHKSLGALLAEVEAAQVP